MRRAAAGRALRAGLAYGAAAFAAGFAFGTVRILWLAPALGRTGAAALEVPLMLALLWAASGPLARRFAVPPGGPRLGMGAAAFGLLMTLEVALALGAFGLTLAEVAAGWATPAGALGIAGQIAFAAFPWLRGRG